MGTTRFSGPVMYSGHGSDSSYLGSWFQNLPIQINPDYIFKYDDFTGVDIDDTDDWTKQVLNSGTLTLLADHVGGWAKSTGDGSTDNSGGSLQGNEIFMAEASKNIYFETRVAVADADDMDIQFYVDRVLVTTTTANIPTSALTPWFCAMSGTTTADAAWCDYVHIAAQRITSGMTQYNIQP